MIKAASLAYAIFISLIIGILCAAILLVFSLNLSLNDYYKVQDKLAQNNQSAVPYLLSNHTSLNSNEKNPLHLFDQDETLTRFDVAPWGMFEMWSIESFHRRDTIQRNFLVAKKRDHHAPALFLRNDGGELKISGKTQIKGDIKIPNGRVKKVTITSSTSLFEAKHIGVAQPSPDKLPKLKKIDFDLPDNHQFYLQSDLEGEKHVNTFDRPTWVISLDSRLEDIHLKGNIILSSEDTLYVRKSCSLEDVIIKAPKVIFEKGFTGSLQVMATSNIILEEEVTLKYPSALLVTSELDEKERGIICKKGSTISGSIVLQGQGLVSEDRNRIEILEGAVIQGTIYCDGKLSLYGKVEGSVYSSTFFHKTPSTSYDNLIFNGAIIGDALPDKFFSVDFEKNDTPEPMIIKKI